MFTHTSEVRVRYGETDQMGYVYYGVYASYLEVARVEALRSLGISYNELEKSGVMMPVITLHIDYKSPAKYDDVLYIDTSINKLPTVRIPFIYRIYKVNKSETIEVCRAETTLICVDSTTRKPIKVSKNVENALKNFF